MIQGKHGKIRSVTNMLQICYRCVKERLEIIKFVNPLCNYKYNCTIAR